MRKHLTNAAYGALDYASYPLGMLAVAPIVLHRIGAAEYGLWMVCTSIVSAGGIIASGFGDAGIQRVAQLRGANRADLMTHAVRALLGTNLALGSAIALLMWVAAPFAAHHLAVSHLLTADECLPCLRIASVLILIRSVETVGVSMQRAFQEYRGTVQISITVRLLTLGCAAVLALAGERTQSIMTGTAIFLIAGTFLQFRYLRRLLPFTSPWPSFHVHETRTLLRSGVFVWLQALGSVIFRQLDRILLGITLGAGIVAPYALSIQFAEPLFGLTASGLSFFFPYLSGRAHTLSERELRRTVLKAFLCNLLLVSSGAGFLLLFGYRFLQLWAGASVAHEARSIFPLIVIGSALSGLSVTGTYAVQALGLFRAAAFISIGSRSGLLLLMLYLLRHHGLHGLAVSRVCYGAAALLIYLPLVRHIFAHKKRGDSVAALTIPAKFQEGASL